MATIPKQIIEMARAHHREVLALDRRSRGQLNARFAEAQRRMRAQLGVISPEKFRAQQLRISNLLVELSGDITTAELEGTLAAMLDQATGTGTGHAVAEIMNWAEYYGAEARPINLGALVEIERPNLIERHANSIAHWGQTVADRVRTELSVATITREGLDNVVDLVDRAIDGERWQAERIVRTETIHAYNAAHHTGLREAVETGQIGRMRKSCIATFDARTDADSFPVHGQVRELNEMFEDGDGRRYLHPPGRPNDREKEIPWLEEEDVANITPRAEGIQRAERARIAQQGVRAARDRSMLTPAERSQDLVLGWTNGSNSERAVAMKAAALQEFGLPGQVWNPNGRVVDPAVVETTSAELRAMYAATQADFQSKGVRQLRLYRGVKTDVAIEGSIEAWTSDPEVARRFAGPDGHVMVGDFDRRRVLSSVESPDWINGRYGDQREYLLLSDMPALEFKAGDWQSGPFRATDIDPDALVAGDWGVLQDSRGRARLEHIPSGVTMLEGEAFTRDALTDAAKYLDTSGHFDAVGLTPLGEFEFDDVRSILRIEYAAAIPERAVAVEGIEILGERRGRVNRKLNPGNPDTWSRRTIEIAEEGVDGYRIDTRKAVVQRNFAIVTQNRADGRPWTFELYHTPTGKRLTEGKMRQFYEAGYRYPEDIGGWQQGHLKAIAERLHDYVDDETGSILPARLEAFERIIYELRDTHAVLDLDVEAAAEKLFANALADEEDPDDFGWLDEMMSVNERNAARRGPSAGHAARVRRSHDPVEPAEVLTPSERFERDVERREAQLRNGRYSRVGDPDYDRAVQAEAKRRQDEASARRLEAQAKAHAAFERVELEAATRSTKPILRANVRDDGERVWRPDGKARTRFEVRVEGREYVGLDLETGATTRVKTLEDATDWIEGSLSAEPNAGERSAARAERLREQWKDKPTIDPDATPDEVRAIVENDEDDE